MKTDLENEVELLRAAVEVLVPMVAELAERAHGVHRAVFNCTPHPYSTNVEDLAGLINERFNAPKAKFRVYQRVRLTGNYSGEFTVTGVHWIPRWGWFYGGNRRQETRTVGEKTVMVESRFLVAEDNVEAV